MLMKSHSEQRGVDVHLMGYKIPITHFCPSSNRELGDRDMQKERRRYEQQHTNVVSFSFHFELNYFAALILFFNSKRR